MRVLVLKFIGRAFLSFFVLETSSLFAANASPSIVNLKILARVANRSISNRDLLIYAAVLNPRSYRPFKRGYLGQADEKVLLQEVLVQVLVEEENKIIGTERVSEKSLDKSFAKLKNKFTRKRWKQFLEDFELTDLDVRTLLKRSLLVEQTLESRLNDSINDLGRTGKQSPRVKMEAAELALQNWIQQLRSRYKVQIFSSAIKEL